MPDITITLEPQPSKNQLKRIAKECPPKPPAQVAAPAVPAPAAPAAVAAQPDGTPLTQLLSPKCTLIARFDNLGNVILLASVLIAEEYRLYRLGDISADKDLLSFKFTVLPGATSAAKPNPDYPNSALVVERISDWSQPWDEEVVHALGGKPYPLGTDPIQQNFLVGGGAKFAINPQNTLQGVYSGPSAGNNMAQLTTVGIARTSWSAILPGTPTKTLSLWLPSGANGTLRVARCDGSKSCVLQSLLIIPQAENGELDDNQVKDILDPADVVEPANAPAKAEGA